MASPKPALADMPNWPRLMSEEQAAAYVSLSLNTFRAGVGELWPKAIRIRRRKLYDRRALDRAVDALAPATSDSPSQAIRRGRQQHDPGGEIAAREVL